MLVGCVAVVAGEAVEMGVAIEPEEVGVAAEVVLVDCSGGIVSSTKRKIYCKNHP